jgi:hypothetical protein
MAEKVAVRPTLSTHLSPWIIIMLGVPPEAANLSSAEMWLPAGGAHSGRRAAFVR